jgi:hypothetical protein
MQAFDRTRAVTICVLAILLTATTACRKIRVAPGVQVAEYEVLSAFLDAKLATRKSVEPLEPTGDGIAKIVIHNITESDEEGFNLQMDGNGQPIPWAQTASSLQSKAPTLKRTTEDAFREVNGQQTTFQRSFHLALDYELIDLTQFDSLFKNGGWPAYYKRFPGSSGILGLSRVGISADGTQALFYASNECGEPCGVGFYVVMERRGGRWMIEKEIETWIS